MTTIDGRPVVTVTVILETTDDIVVNWSMDAGPCQTGDGELGMTPGIVPGDNDATFDSAC